MSEERALSLLIDYNLIYYALKIKRSQCKYIAPRLYIQVDIFLAGLKFQKKRDKIILCSSKSVLSRGRIQLDHQHIPKIT